jgi:hypothetical protein
MTDAARPIARHLTGAEAAAVTARDHRPGLVRHIVLFSFAPGTAVDAVEETERRFRALAESRRSDGEPYIVSIVAGPQTSPEDTPHDLDLGFVVTFASEGDRNYYVGEPLIDDERHFDAQHAAFKRFVGPLVDDVVVFDIVDPADTV